MKWGNIRCVVMDFDCTITVEHTGGRASSVEQVSCEYIQNNTKSGFVEFVKAAQTQGVPLWIATYGDDAFAESKDDVAGHALVKRYMDVLLGADQSLFLEPTRNDAGKILAHHRVIARLSGDRKAFHWNVIRRQVGEDFDPSTILFLDDSEANLGFARDLGCELLVPGSSDKSALVCASELLFELLLDRMKSAGVTDAVE